MKFFDTDSVRILMPNLALQAVFDECDRFTTQETGGRILGTFEYQSNVLIIKVTGIIEPGPAATRTASYLQQDGVYQERVFRQVEEHEPAIEHLGNWHTHHVNGMPHLSDGDIATYRRTVEHHNHNTDFFYALLVIAKRHSNNPLERYHFKNYLLRSGDSKIYEVPPHLLSITDAPLIWPVESRMSDDTTTQTLKDEDAYRQNRIYDSDFTSQFYPDVRIFKSKQLGISWRGTISLLGEYKVELAVIEDDSGRVPQFSVTFRQVPKHLKRSAQALSKRMFPSCRNALLSTERACNAELYEQMSKSNRRKRWIF